MTSQPLMILKSAAGFYIGTSCKYEGPISRQSVEYWPTHEQAEKAFKNNRWTLRSNH